MNEDWSKLHKEVKALLNNRFTFKEGIYKLIELRTMLINE